MSQKKGFFSKMFGKQGGGCCDLQIEEIPKQPGEQGENSCCCGGTMENLPTEASDAQTRKRRLEIEFMFIDLEVCNRCQGTDSSLEAAVSETAQVLEAAGIDVNVKKIHVQTEEQARELGFISSPTIRLNGRDLQLEVKESLCESCGDVCGEEVDCRVWTYQGKEYTVPPKAMIVDAILREVYGGSQEETERAQQAGEVPDNLKRFFAAKKEKEQGLKQRETSESCCGCGPGCCS